MDTCSSNQRLSRQHRLTKSTQFKEAFAQKRQFVGHYMVMWLRQGSDASLRVGIIASRRVSRKACARNRAKRHLREAFRLNRSAFQGEADVVLVARQAILGAKWPAIQNDLLSLAKRSGLLQTKT